MGNTDKTAEFLAERGLGSPLGRVALRGGLEIPGGKSQNAELCLTSSGLYLVAAFDRWHGAALDVLEQSDLRYERGKLEDRLVLRDTALNVPAGKSSAALRLIALGRLQAQSARELSGELFRTRYVVEPTDVERDWLKRELSADEVLLGFLPGATRVKVPSAILRDSEARLHLLVTSDRAALVAVSEAGDVVCHALDPKTFATRFEGGRHSVVSGNITLQSARSSAKLFGELTDLIRLPKPENVLETARRIWLRRGKRVPGEVRTLLREATRLGETRAVFASLGVELEQNATTLSPEALALALDSLKQAGMPPETLADLWSRWEFSAAVGRELIDQLRMQGERAEPWALFLHRRVHPKLITNHKVEAARADITRAEHELATGQGQTARTLLKLRLEELARDDTHELLPVVEGQRPSPGSLAGLRIQIYELLERHAASQGEHDTQSLRALARLEPLSESRVQALVDVAEGSVADRARTLLSALKPGGLSQREQTEIRIPSAALPTEVKQRTLTHPLAREGSPFVSELQTLLAVAPDLRHDMLRDYCEALNEGRHPAAARALHAGRVLFDLREFKAYVSRGNKSVGLRVYDGTPAFLLIGSGHLDAGSPLEMTGAELAFAIGAEIAHLALGHARVTSSEVWTGALLKTREGMELVLGALPLLRGWRFADKIARVAQTLPQDAMRRTLDTLMRIERSRKPANDDPNTGVLSHINEDLIAAHRLMQLTADRAGLLLSGDLISSLRAILMVRSDYRDVLSRAESMRLGDVVYPGSGLHNADLHARLTAVCSFWLSDEYEALRRAAHFE